MWSTTRKIHADLNVNPENLSESRNRTVFGAAVQRSVDALRREYQDLKDLKENILGPSIKTPVPEKQPNAASRPTRQKQVVVGTDGEEYTINDVLNLQSEAINLRGLVSRLQAMDVPVGPQVSREQYDALIGDIDGLKAVIAGLEAERDDLCSALQEAKFMNLKLDEKRREWQETEDKLLQRIEELKHEVDTRAEVVDSRASAASQLRSQLSELEKRYDALVFTVKELGEQKTSLIDGLREKQCQLELVISKLQIVEEQMGRKDAMLASYQKSISGASTMEKENQQLKKDLEEAKSNARRVKQDYDQLKLTQTTPMPSDRHAKPSMVLGPSPRERADITREQAVDIKLGPRTEEVIASEVKIRELEKDLASKEERLRELSAQQNTTHTALKDLTAAYTSLLQVHEKVLANVKVRMGTIDFNNLQLELDQVKKTAQLMGLDFEATLEKQAEAQGKVIQLSGELETHQSELAAANERNAQLQAELQLLQRGKDVMLDRMARKRDVVGAQPDDDEANEDLNPWIKGRVARRLVVGWFSSKHKTVECVVLFQPAHLGFVDFKGEFPVNPKPKPKNQIKYSDILAVNYGPQARATAM
ncbi:MAG: uncharacterized protein KVP18_001763 [Porospora cf. gigantea A]|uniref:uncharacterized protein n=1 Tax=Porospora cf. gigantea A TaxID=2853593 RepID=UPI00355A69BA|nr:MAG: hypothetical protein KVP18_001763 [Porospora cf. gigantea A]